MNVTVPTRAYRGVVLRLSSVREDGFTYEIRLAHRFGKVGAERDMGGDRARQRAAGAVQVGRSEPRSGEAAHARGGDEQIDRFVAGEMAAFHQHGARP